MTFSFPTIKEFIKILSIDRTSTIQHMKQEGENFYYLLHLLKNVVAQLYMKMTLSLL